MLNKHHSKNKTIKHYRHSQTAEIDDHDFIVKPLKQMRLIDNINGLDDECEFNKDMYNFGDEEDLPDSDRATDRRCKNN